MNRTSTTLTLAAVLAAAALAGCNRAGDDRTVGQKVDDAAVVAQQKTESAVQRTTEAVKNAGETIADKAGDAAITASVNAELAKDPSLSALKIDVDTAAGRVVLRGAAPTADARERATRLAQGVRGVTGVDNQLEVRS